MKKIQLAIACMLLISLSAWSQSKLNLVIFSEDGDQFTLFVNGIKQNNNPESNVKVTELTSANVNMRIEFSDKALLQLKQSMAMELGFEHTYKIKRDKNNQAKLRYFGQTPIGQPSGAGAVKSGYNTADNSSTSNNSTPTNNNTITETTTSTQTGNGGNTSVNINMGAAGISMNVTGMDPNAGTMKTTTSTTVTSSSSSTNYDSMNSGSDSRNSAPAASGSTKSACSVAMSNSNFAKMKESVESKPFSDTKMSTAKVATKNACLSVEQVKEICKLFSMDDEKLAYAKYAYDYCVDKTNYYQISEVFSFSGTTDEFNQFLENH